MDEITTKEVKFVNDPKNLSALAKIHEISNKAKERRSRKSPTHINHIRYEAHLKIDNNQDESNFSRRKNHFPTMRYPFLNILKPKEDILKSEGKRKNYINQKEKGDSKGTKPEYIWDKNLNKLVEKKVPTRFGLDKIEEKEEKVEPQNEKSSEKGEIIKKLKDYKKSKETSSGKKTDIIYEKRIVKEGEIEDDEDDDKNIVGSKNTKIYKKIIKDEKGSKIIIKKVVEEISDSKEGDKLVFDDDSGDDEDLEKELDKIEKDTSEKNDMKYQIIKEKFDPKGNKIYSKEIFTNKMPKK